MKIIFNPLTGKFDYVVNKLTELSTRNHNDTLNRDVAAAHPSEAVGVLSPSSMFPEDIGKNWNVGILVGVKIRKLIYAGNGLVIAGDLTNGNIYRSTDYGLTWSAGIPVTFRIYSLTYVGNGIVIAGNDTGDIYRSTDYGLTWSAGIPVGTGITSLIYIGNGVVIAGDDMGDIYRSTDYGLAWGAGIPVGFGSSLSSLTYAGDGVVIAGDDGKIYRSSDYGITWSAGIQVGIVLDDLIYAGNGVVIAGDDGNGNIYRSTDYGLTWGAGIPVGTYIRSLTYAGNGVVIAGDDMGDIYRSTDYGLTWGAGIPVGVIILSLTYAGNGIVIAGDENGKIYRSDVAYKIDEMINHSKAVHDALLIDADTLDNLHGTGYTKTTAGQTINVSTAAELTAALAALAAAPSLLGNVIIQLAAGTYADNVTIPILLGGRYTLTIQGSTTTNFSSTATGGTAGDIITQATVIKTGAGWTVNVYRGQWIQFTSGALSGLIRCINSNTADTITLVGAYFASAPQNGDAFIIYSNNATITGTIQHNPHSLKTIYNNLIISNTRISTIRSVTDFNYCRFNIGSGGEQEFDYIYDNSSIRFYRCYLYYNGSWSGQQAFGGFLNPCQCYFYGNNIGEFGFMLKSAYFRVQKGNVFENFGLVAIWSDIGGSGEFHGGGAGSTDEIDGGEGAITKNWVKNNVLGLDATAGGHISSLSNATLSGNTTNYTADAASYSWIG